MSKAKKIIIKNGSKGREALNEIRKRSIQKWNKKRYLVKKTMIDRQIEKISLFTNGIDFIDENDGGRSLLGLREQASNP